MTALDVFAFVVMAVLAAAVGLVVVMLGALPGKIARQRGNPQAQAINVCGWLGVLTLGLLWPVALIWAFVRAPGAVQTGTTGDSEAPHEELRTRLEQVSARLEVLENASRTPGSPENGPTP